MATGTYYANPQTAPVGTLVWRWVYDPAQPGFVVTGKAYGYVVGYVGDPAHSVTVRSHRYPDSTDTGPLSHDRWLVATADDYCACGALAPCTLCGSVERPRDAATQTCRGGCDAELDALIAAARRLGEEYASTHGYRESGPLSGEWADDWTPRDLAAQLGVAPDGDTLAMLCDAFEYGYWVEVAR